MNAAKATSPHAAPHASLIVIGIGFALSLAVHLGVGMGASGYFGSAWSKNESSNSAIEMQPEEDQTIPPAEKLKLGMQDATQASINWLGVIDNPEIGDVPIAPVEQAQFTTQVGDAPTTNAPEQAATPTPIAQEPSVQEPLVQEPVEPPVIEPEPIEQETKPAASEQIELEPPEAELAPVIIEPQPEPIEEPIEGTVGEASEDTTEELTQPEQAISPELISVDPSPPTQEAAPAAPTTSGKPGVVSEKESAASMIKRAEKIDVKNLHKPIVGKGFEITTVEPKFPATVRFTELPRNPVLIIRFNAQGRVSKVYFLTEKKRVWNTGAKGVDEPLLSAVYQWRAKGKVIDALEPNNPESFLEIPMRITFRKERDDS